MAPPSPGQALNPPFHLRSAALEDALASALSRIPQDQDWRGTIPDVRGMRSFLRVKNELSSQIVVHSDANGVAKYVMNGFGGRLISMEDGGGSSFIYFKIPAKARMVEFFLNATVVKGTDEEVSILLNSVSASDERLEGLGTPTSPARELQAGSDSFRAEIPTSGILNTFSGRWQADDGGGELSERWTQSGISARYQRKKAQKNMVRAQVRDGIIAIKDEKYNCSLITVSGEVDVEERNLSQAAVPASGLQRAFTSKTSFRQNSAVSTLTIGQLRKQSTLGLGIVEEDAFGSQPSQMASFSGSFVGSGVARSARSGITRGKSTLIGSKEGAATNQGSKKAETDSQAVIAAFREIARRLYEKFEDKDRVDREATKQCVEEDINNPPPFCAMEEAILKSNQGFADRSGWKNYPGYDTDPVKYSKRFDPGDRIACGKAEAVVHTSAKEILAYLLLFTSYARNDEHYAKQGKDMPRVDYKIQGMRAKYFCDSMKMQKPFRNRIFEVVMTWEQYEDPVDGAECYRLAFVPAEEFRPPNTRLVRCPQVPGFKFGKSRGFYTLKALAPNVTLVKLVHQVDFAGHVPYKVAETSIKKLITIVDSLYRHFRRNGKIVDREVRAELMRRMLAGDFKDLHEDQIEIKSRCEELGVGHFTKLASRTPDLDFWTKDFDREKTKVENACGKSECVVDCSPEEALAWHFDYCSNERCRISMEKGETMRLSFRSENKSNEVQLVTSKVLPRPFYDRAFIVRYILHFDPVTKTGKIYIENVDSAHDTSEFGSNHRRTSRGFLSGFISTEVLPSQGGVPQTKVTLVQCASLGRALPYFASRILLQRSLRIIHTSKLIFDKSTPVDEAQRQVLAKFVKDSTQVYSEEEISTWTSLRQNLDSLDDGEFEMIPTPNRRWKVMRSVGVSRTGTFRAIATIDAPLEICASYELMKMTRERLESHYKDGVGLRREVVELNPHSDLFYLVVNVGQRLLQHREFFTRSIWKYFDNDRNSFAVGYVDAEDDRFPPLKNHVRASVSSFIRFDRLKPIEPIGVAQTKVTFTCTMDARGYIPKSISNSHSSAISILGLVKTLQDRFDMSKTIDAASRDRIREKLEQFGDIRIGRISPTPEDREIVELADILEHHILDFQKVEKLHVPVAKHLIKVDVGKRTSWGRASVTLKAPLLEAVAFFWDFDSRYLTKSGGVIDRSVVPGSDAFSMVMTRRHKISSALVQHRDRVFINDVKVLKLSDDEVLIYLSPHSGPVNTSGSEWKRVTLFGRVLVAKETTAIRLTRMRGDHTSVRMMTKLEMPDGHSGFNSMKQGIVNLTQPVLSAFKFFLSLQELNQLDSRDGESFAELLLHVAEEDNIFRSETAKIKHRVKTLFTEMRGLREAKEKYDWIEPLIEAVLLRKLTKPRDVSTPANNVSHAEATKIGASFAINLALNLTGEGAVDAWMMRFPALLELDKDPDFKSWFRPMMNKIGVTLLGRVGWGLKTRVAIGAILSFLDLVSDVAVAYVFLREEEYLYCYFTMGTVLMNLFLSMALGVFQHWRAGPMALFKEFLYISFALKPVVDGYRVVYKSQDEKWIESRRVNPMVELTATKVLEIFAEAVPGCILQMYAYIQRGKTSSVAQLSILVAALSVGFSSATISYDWDVDPRHRKARPTFYGYVPDDGDRRAELFSAMAILSASVFMLRSLAVALLAVVGKDSAVAYVSVFMSADLALFLLVKVLRGDFLYWVPVEGFEAYPLALLMRVVMKVVTDFTAIVQFRHPNEMGGLYFSLNVLSTLLLPVPMLFVYEHRLRDEDTKLKQQLQGLWSLYFSGLVVSMTCIMLIHKTMNKSFIGTFISTKTAPQTLSSMFMDDSTPDSEKAEIFGHCRQMWAQVRPEVKFWVKTNWDTWQDAQPAWFTSAVRISIPQDMIPTSHDLEEIKKIRDSSEKRGSYSHLFGIATGKGKASATVQPSCLKVSDPLERE